MRLEGKLETIQEIEKFIKKNTQYDVIKNQEREAICPVAIESSYEVKHFVIYTAFYEFDIRLTFNFRDNKGEMQINNYNSQNLFMKYPELLKLFSQMNNNKMTEYTKGKKTTELIPIKESNA